MIAPGDALFRHYPAAVRPASPPEALGNAGGLSGASLFRFRSGRGELVARRWPADRPPRGQLDSIHGWLARAGDHGFVPVPLPTLDGRTLVDLGGHAWEVAPWMPGVADLSRPPSVPRLRLAFAGLAAFLGRLAGGGVEGPSPGLARRASQIRLLIGGGFAEVRARIDRAPAGPETVPARRWLELAPPLAARALEASGASAARPLPLQPCLRDARPDHFLFDGGRLSGLVDFGAMGVDTVAGDLARLLDGAPGPARLEALAAFEAIRPLSAAEHRAVGAFERCNALLAPISWIRWHFFEARAFDDPDAVALGLARCLARLEERV